MKNYKNSTKDSTPNSTANSGNSFLPRRQFIQMGATAGAGLFFLPMLMKGALAAQIGKKMKMMDEDPHFFLMITLPNASGVDASYLWDARPLAMTSAGVIQNYRGTEASPWVGSNGVSTLATEIVNPLLPYKNDFSVLNGVMMDVGFDGHEQNINYLFAGDPFGGECFIPHFNVADANHRALDAIKRGRYAVAETNGGQMVPLNPSAAHSLINSIGKVPSIDPNSHLIQFLSSRFTANGSGSGSFSGGSSLMSSSFNATSALSAKFTQVQTSGNDTDQGFIQLAGEIFRTGVAKSAVLVLDPGENVYDSHDPGSASRQPKAYADLVSSLATVFATMKATPFDANRSLYDVTTVMFVAEFGRTMRQKIHPVDSTGTDHNPLANCVLLGGKGIKGGQVIGSTDFNSAGEVLSGAHLSLDPDKVKVVGKPFDFNQTISRTDMPAVYSAGDYLGFNSIINTLYQMYGVPSSKWRVVERNGAVAPVLKGILS